MRCVAKRDTSPDIFECERCGRPLKLQPHGIGLPVNRECHKPGLGDYIATGLAAIGITKQRVNRLLGKKCKCDKRQEALNELGKKVGL